MDIKINKNFEREYKDNAWRGFSLKEIITLLFAVIQVGIELFFIYQYTNIDLTVAVYFAIPTAIPVLACGFFTYQGMSPLQFLKEWHYSQKTKILTYQAEEWDDRMARIFTTASRRQPGLGKKERKQLIRQHKQEIQKYRKGGN